MGTVEVMLTLLVSGDAVVGTVLVSLVLGAENAPLAPVVGMKSTIVIDSCSSCCGAGASNVSSLGVEHVGPVVAFPPQQAHREDVVL